MRVTLFAKRARILAGIAVFAGALVVQAQTQVVQINGCSRDWVSPWAEVEGDNSPGFCQELNGVTGLAKVGNGVIAQYDSVQFPHGSLTGITIKAGVKFKEAKIQFSIGTKDSLINFAACSSVVTDSFGIYAETECNMQPALNSGLDAVDFGGCWNIYVQFVEGGGPVGEGVGNFAWFKFFIDTTATDLSQTWESLGVPGCQCVAPDYCLKPEFVGTQPCQQCPPTQSLGRPVLRGAMEPAKSAAKIFAPGSRGLTSGEYYDIRGRKIRGHAGVSDAIETNGIFIRTPQK